MNITAAGLRRYDLRLQDAWTTARASTTIRSGFLLWLRDEQGRMAWGDASPLLGPRRPGLRVVENNLRALVEIVQRDTPEASLDPPLGGELEGATRHAWVQAVLGLEAQAAKRSLAQHLARMRDHEGPEPASTVPVNAVVSLLPTKATVVAATEALDRGYTCLKIKVDGSRPQIARIAAVRKAVGPDVKLRLDANGSWDELDAMPLLEGMAPYGIDYVEQPLPPARLGMMERLHKTTPIPLAVDESAHNYAQAMGLLEKDCLDVVVLKPLAMGGLDRALRLMDQARKHKVRVIVTDSVESAIGRAGAIHLSALLGRRAEPCGLASGERLVEDVLRKPPPVVKGRIDVPDAPGLGVEPGSEGPA